MFFLLFSFVFSFWFCHLIVLSASACTYSPSWSSYFTARLNKSRFFFLSLRVFTVHLCSEPFAGIHVVVIARKCVYTFLIMWSIALRQIAQNESNATRFFVTHRPIFEKKKVSLVAVGQCHKLSGDVTSRSEAAAQILLQFTCDICQ